MPQPGDILVSSSGTLSAQGKNFSCSLGRGGVSHNKQEGDGTTPAGIFPLRKILYRPDRISAPLTRLSCAPIMPSDGWCDDPVHPSYNRPVIIPFSGSCETLWRGDHAYDLIVVIGYNDSPIVPGAGSAIFMHAKHPDGRPTEGCVALEQNNLIEIISGMDEETKIIISL